MKNSIEYLKKDRKVNETFIKKLEGLGLEVNYGKYNYWDNQEYVKIGRKKIWLVCVKTQNGNSSIGFRYQNSVISDIEDAISNETAKAEKADEQVTQFFEKLSK